MHNLSHKNNVPAKKVVWLRSGHFPNSERMAKDENDLNVFVVYCSEKVNI